MLKYYSSYALVFSNLTHFLCCGIPTLLSLSTLLSSFIFFETLASNLELLEIYEIYFFILTTLIFILIISLEIYKRRARSVSQDYCDSKYECDSSKKKIKLNISIASILYLVNSSFFLSEIIF